MRRISLIALRAAGAPWPSRTLAACRAGLEEAGHSVEVLVVSDPTSCPTVESLDPWCESMLAPAPGLSEAAVAGLRAARGDWLVLLDAGRAYAPEDVFGVIARLAEGDASLVVASGPRPLTGSGLRRIAGSSDPCSGLVGLTREAAIRADGAFSPIGSRFTVEILARVAGRRADVPVGRVAPSGRRGSLLDDVRLAKRLADDRFGTASRLIQFCFVGASGMVVDLTCYAVFQALLSRTGLANWGLTRFDGSIAPAASAVLAIAVALTWNFSINRRLTFNDARRGSIGAQYLRYVLSNLLGIAVSLTLRLALPGMFGYFGRHRLAAAVAGIVSATGLSFTMARWFVFDRKAAPATSHAPRRASIRSHEAARGPLAGRHGSARPLATAGAKSPALPLD